MSTAREALDQQMRDLLCAIELCSHVPAAQIGYSTGGSQHPSRMLAGGDTGALKLARRYDQARDDRERQHIIDDARAELALIRGNGSRELPAGESPDDTVARMLQETEGWTPEDVEQSRWKMPARMVRRYRVNAGRDADTGKPSAPIDENATRREQVLEMHARGMTQRQIAMRLGVSQPTVLRDLGKRAA